MFITISLPLIQQPPSFPLQALKFHHLTCLSVHIYKKQNSNLPLFFGNIIIYQYKTHKNLTPREIFSNKNAKDNVGFLTKGNQHFHEQ